MELSFAISHYLLDAWQSRKIVVCIIELTGDVIEYRFLHRNSCLAILLFGYSWYLNKWVTILDIQEIQSYNMECVFKRLSNNTYYRANY